MEMYGFRSGVYIFTFNVGGYRTNVGAALAANFCLNLQAIRG